MTEQPVTSSKKPNPKVAAAGAGGALATIVIVVLEAAGVDVSPELAAAIATIIAFAAGYLTPPKGV